MDTKLIDRTSKQGPSASQSSEEKADSSGKRNKSPNYPVIGITDALAHAKTLWEKEKRAEVPLQLVAKHLGFSSLNGRSRRVLSAMKAYGLVGEREDQLKLTDEGIKAAVLPQGDPERAALVSALAARPPIFQKLLSKFSEELPSDENLKAKLITEFDFVDDGADACIRAFKEALPFVKAQQAGQNDAMQNAFKISAPPSPDEERQAPPAPQHSAPAQQGRTQPPFGAPTLVGGGAWTLSIAVSKTELVQLSATAPLSAKQYERLIKALMLNKENAAEDEAEADSEA